MSKETECKKSLFHKTDENSKAKILKYTGSEIRRKRRFNKKSRKDFNSLEGRWEWEFQKDVPITATITGSLRWIYEDIKEKAYFNRLPSTLTMVLHTWGLNGVENRMTKDILDIKFIKLGLISLSLRIDERGHGVKELGKFEYTTERQKSFRIIGSIPLEDITITNPEFHYVAPFHVSIV